MNKILVLTLVMLMAGCGYHLRGTFNLPPELKKVALVGGSAKLREQFKKSLQESSGQLVAPNDASAMKVRVVDSDIKQRSLSLSAGGRSNEFELYYRLEYELRDADNTILAEREPLDIRREYFNDQQDIIAKDNEEGVIRTEMYQQAVKNILNRLQAVMKSKPK